MAIADRLRDVTRPTNTIVEAREPSLERPQDLHRANPSPAPSDAPAPQGAAKKGAAYKDEPDHIAKAYYVEAKGNERSYFDDYKRSSVAMRATDTTISTKREDMNTVRAMVDIAAARGWQSIDVAGSKEFKREAWIEAAARGIEAKGYRPSDPDRQEADKRRNERGLENEVRGPAPTNPATPAAPITPNNPDPTPADPDRQQATSRASAPGAGAPAASAPGATKGEPDKAAPILAAVASDRPGPATAPAAGKGEPDKAPASAAAKGEPNKAASKEAPGKPAGEPSMKENQRAVREAQKELSPNGRTIFAAMSEKIDREMNRYAGEGKAQMKAYVATELVKKERTEGPIVLSAEHKRAIAAPEPARPEPARSAPEPTRQMEPEAPRRSLGR